MTTASINVKKLGPKSMGCVQARSDQIEKLPEIIERLASGEFHKPILWDDALGKISPTKCIDGRLSKNEPRQLAPCSASGTESLMIADDLTAKSFSTHDHSTLGAFKDLVDFLQKEGYAIGGHSGDHSCCSCVDCGANDKIRIIYHYIAENHEYLRQQVEEFGIKVDNSVDWLIAQNAINRKRFSDRHKIYAYLKDKADERLLDWLMGDHNEVAVVLNFRPNTTLDRHQLAEAFGPGYGAFNVDVWSFMDAAWAISESEAEAEQKYIAMLYYNLATALSLCGSEMNVIEIR